MAIFLLFILSRVFQSCGDAAPCLKGWKTGYKRERPKIRSERSPERGRFFKSETC